MEIQISGVKKYYHSEGKIIKALDGVNLTIPANKIFTLLGPSGCGKTTLLRSIVGLETPDEGEIRIGDTIVWSSEKRIDVPTEKRGLGMVFQTYAIWPHMDVFNNVAYPLQNMKLPKDEIVRRVEKTLQFVQLEGFGSRPATRLSGGQQQRVALARALVAEPKVILFDEPLSNLDAKLREETRKELRSFLSELQITAVYVTHDRIEALALSDQIGVMRAGNIIEIGDPKKIYSIGTFTCSKREFPAGSEITLCIRPEFVDLIDPADKGKHQNTLTGRMHTMVFVGEVYESEIMVGDQLIMVKVDPDSKVKEGDEVVVSIAAEHCLLVAR